MSSGNFGKQKSNFNNITGATIITSTKNQSVFEENYDKMLSGEALQEAQKRQQVTMFPITFPIPQQLYKELEVLGNECGATVQTIAQRIFLEATSGK